jgi:hypothetical protein
MANIYICAALPQGSSHPDVGQALRRGLYRNFHTHSGFTGEPDGAFDEWVHRHLHGEDVRHGHITIAGWSGQVLEMIRHPDRVIRFHDRGELGAITGWYRWQEFDHVARPAVIESLIPDDAARILSECGHGRRDRMRAKILAGQPFWLTRSGLIRILIANQDAHALAHYLGRWHPQPEAVIARIRPCQGPRIEEGRPIFARHPNTGRFQTGEKPLAHGLRRIRPRTQAKTKHSKTQKNG